MREVEQGGFHGQPHYHPSYIEPISGPYSEHPNAFRQAGTPYGKDNTSLLQIAKQWNMKFTGRGDTIVITFLDRVERGRAIDSLSEEDVLVAMPFLLDGIRSISVV